MTAAALWTAVKSDYDTNGLISLTNIGDRSAVAINDTTGQAAAQAVINLWSIFADEDYDGTSAAHVEVAELGVIAMLWRRGGSCSTIEQVKWDTVFSSDGMIARVRRTGSRARSQPATNSGVSQKSELSCGRQVRGWSDRDSLPNGILPDRKIARD